MIIKSIGFKNSGVPKTHNMRDGSTVADLASDLGVDMAHAEFQIDGRSVTGCEVLFGGVMVGYTMTNIKGN